MFHLGWWWFDGSCRVKQCSSCCKTLQARKIKTINKCINVKTFFVCSVPCIVLAAQYKLTPSFLPESKRLEASCLVSPGWKKMNFRWCVKVFLQALFYKGLKLKLAEKCDAWIHFGLMWHPTLSPCLFLQTVAIRLHMFIGWLEISITRRTELYLCSER